MKRLNNSEKCCIEEIESELPNGFHDAKLISCNINYIHHSIHFEMDLYICDSYDISENINTFKRGELIIFDFLYCAIDPPDINFNFQNDGLWIASSGQIDKNNKLIKIPFKIPHGYFSYYFFINDWNSFIYFIAKNVSFRWT